MANIGTSLTVEQIHMRELLEPAPKITESESQSYYMEFPERAFAYTCVVTSVSESGVLQTHRLDCFEYELIEGELSPEEANAAAIKRRKYMQDMSIKRIFAALPETVLSSIALSVLLFILTLFFTQQWTLAAYVSAIFAGLSFVISWPGFAFNRLFHGAIRKCKRDSHIESNYCTKTTSSFR